MKYANHPLVDARAQEIYAGLTYPASYGGAKPAWMLGGNSIIQDDCRRAAIEALKAEGVDLFGTYWTFERAYEDRRILGRLLNPSVLAFEISAAHTPADRDIRTEFEGTVSFDGCFNWSTSANYNVHMCDLSEFLDVHHAFEIVREIAAENIESWIA